MLFNPWHVKQTPIGSKSKAKLYFWASQNVIQKRSYSSMFLQMPCHLLGVITKQKLSRGQPLLRPLRVILSFLKSLKGLDKSDSSLPLPPLLLSSQFLPSFHFSNKSRLKFFAFCHPSIHLSVRPSMHPSI